MLNPNKVYGRENLLKLVWGSDYPGDVRTVDVHIRRLREKIETNPSEPKYVHTRSGGSDIIMHKGLLLRMAKWQTAVSRRSL